MAKKGFINLNIANHRVLLWILAIVISLASAVYQRMTGPTYPFRGKAVIAGEEISYSLLRTEIVSQDADVSVAVMDTAVTGYLIYKRFKSFDEWSRIPMTRKDSTLSAALPHQPSAGKLIYTVHLEKGREHISITGDRPVIIRYRGSVPLWVVLPHVLLIFLAMAFSNRAGLDALDEKGKSYTYMIWTIAIFFVSGFIFGPLMQKFAFGKLWTGFPLGTDLTDNKSLIAMIGWIIALVMNSKGRKGRAWIFFAAVLMLGIFLIPHSMLGSEIDYTQLPQN